MTLGKIAQIGVGARVIVGFGVAQRVEQQVGDLRHGGNYHQHGPVAGLSCANLRGDPDALCRAHAGAPEFHD